LDYNELLHWNGSKTPRKFPVEGMSGWVGGWVGG
jgi:hypothetical protein